MSEINGNVKSSQELDRVYGRPRNTTPLTLGTLNPFAWPFIEPKQCLYMRIAVLGFFTCAAEMEEKNACMVINEGVTFLIKRDPSSYTTQP